MRPARLLALGGVLLFAACDVEPTGPDAIPIASDAAPSVTASATYLVDTGPGGTNSTGSSSLFSAGSTNCSPQPQCAEHYQFIAGKFTLTSEATVEALEGWMTVTFGGSLAVKILSDNAGVPGTTVLASQTFAVPSSVPFNSFGWAVFSNYNVVLQPATYWVSFEPVANSGFHGSMQGGAASPLQDYAFYSEGNNRWVAYSLFNQNPGFGMRVFGTPTTPPDPPSETTAEMVTDLRATIAELDLARGTRNSLDATLRTALNALTAEDSATACAALQDFINQVRAQRRKIGAATADALNAEAADIRTAIGC